MSCCFPGWIQHHFPTHFPQQTNLLPKVCDAGWPWWNTSIENIALRLHIHGGFSTFSSMNPLFRHVCILTVNKHQIHLWWRTACIKYGYHTTTLSLKHALKEKKSVAVFFQWAMHQKWSGQFPDTSTWGSGQLKSRHGSRCKYFGWT